jgi:hypothetical protein
VVKETATMTDSDTELGKQLEALDWGAGRTEVTQTEARAYIAPRPKKLPRKDRHAVGDDSVPAPAAPQVEVTHELDGLDLEIPGVKPRVRRVHRKTAGAEVVVPAHIHVARPRRPRDTQPDILVARGESPAVIALFEQMWRTVGHQLALDVSRPKASKQDAALGWYMFLMAMRARDASAARAS